MLTLREELPHFRAEEKSGHSAWLLDLSGYDAFLTAWQAGQAFWSGYSVWGQWTTIRLGQISGVYTVTEESIELVKTEAVERKRRTKAEELLDA